MGFFYRWSQADKQFFYNQLKQQNYQNG